VPKRKKEDMEERTPRLRAYTLHQRPSPSDSGAGPRGARYALESVTEGAP
jgi:hypothetical protein